MMRTLLKPSLVVNRLIVKRGGGFVYDQKFHKGVNIIRGDNGTGKSTVMDLLYFSLGAELAEWTDEQLSCDETIVEVDINGHTCCLKRDIAESGKSPMELHQGRLEEALSETTDWYRYPVRRTKDKHSFSQQLFDMLGLPQHKTDESRNLTMHQLLRLMYVDQLTAPTKLLKEDSFDNASLRKAIGEYVLGLDDLEAHHRLVLKPQRNTGISPSFERPMRLSRFG